MAGFWALGRVLLVSSCGGMGGRSGGMNGWSGVMGGWSVDWLCLGGCVVRVGVA